MKIGILHPGSMGVSVARSILNDGHEVFWASEGRGPATVERARQHGLTDIGTLNDLCRESEIIFSICPPESASDVASAVKDKGFAGTFVDCNAISPQRMQTIADELSAAGICRRRWRNYRTSRPGSLVQHGSIFQARAAEKVAACGIAAVLCIARSSELKSVKRLRSRCATRRFQKVPPRSSVRHPGHGR